MMASGLVCITESASFITQNPAGIVEGREGERIAPDRGLGHHLGR